MTLDLTNIIKELQQDKGISEDLIITTIETALTKAYEKYYGTIENLVIRKDDELILSIFSKKEVVDEVDDDLFEIDLKSAKVINNEAEIGDEMLVPCNPEEFGRIEIHSAKQIILQRLKEIKKDSIFSDYKAKEGELIIGYIQRIRGDIFYIDLGSYEGILPKKNIPPHEEYHQGDRIKSIIDEVKKTNKGNISVVLSRTSPNFVKKLFEIEIPEIYDKTVIIEKIVREPGYRTKIAVSTHKDEIDPVGSCVGQKGARINNIIKELEDEKIDVIKWTLEPRLMIANALIPAKVDNVIISDESKKKAIAIVDQSQLSYAIGKKGLNIKLANILSGWDIDVKTLAQAKELKLIPDHIQAAEQLFKEDIGKNEIDELELSDVIKEILKKNNINTIEQIVELNFEQIKLLTGMNEEHANELKSFIDENFEIVIEEDEAEATQTEVKPKEIEENKADNDENTVYYECPNCGAKITENETSCPSCGVEIAFEEDEGE